MSLADYFQPTPLNIIGTCLILAISIAWAVVLRARYTDRVWVGVTPGDEPAELGTAPTRAGRYDIVPIQFSPPVDIEPAEANLLLNGTVGWRAIAASLTQLIWTGFVERVPPNQWRVAGKAAAIGAGADIGTFSGQVAIALMDTRAPTFTLEDASRSRPAALRLSRAKDDLVERAYKDKQWYAASFRQLQQAAIAVGRVSLIVGIGYLFVIWWILTVLTWDTFAQVFALGGVTVVGVIALAIYLAIRRYHTRFKFWAILLLYALFTWFMVSIGYAMEVDTAPTNVLPWWQIWLTETVLAIMLLSVPYIFVANLFNWAAPGRRFVYLILIIMSILALGQIRPGWCFVALVASGVLLLWAARRKPPLTPQGSAALARVRGFRQFLFTADLNQLKYEVGEQILSDYLPWAIAFDLRGQWTEFIDTMGRIGTTSQKSNWYDDSVGEDDDVDRIPADGWFLLNRSATALDQGARSGQLFITYMGSSIKRTETA